ncbi:CsbD family protein, partial [Rhizobium ruizarguesonis]
MDWYRIEGNWKQAKGKIKDQWGKLTDDDLDQIAGKRRHQKHSGSRVFSVGACRPTVLEPLSVTK